jgi:MFS transporter, DHA3 family, macrolide efflux protein
MAEQVAADISGGPARGWLPRFLIVWTGQSISFLGTAVVQFSLIWWLTQTTGSATILSIAALAGVLPQVLVGPFAGAVVDRFNRKRLMILADAIAALASLVIVLLASGGALQTWHVLAAMFVRSVMQAVHGPAMQASTSMLVPPQHLTRVGGLNQIVQGLNNIGAPVAGALLVGRLPIGTIVMIDVVSAAAAILGVALVVIPQPARESARRIADVLEDFCIGLAYARGWKGLLVLFGVAALVNSIIAPAVSLMALLVSRYFRGTPDDLAVIQIALGIGILGGGVLLSIWGGFRKRVHTSLAGLVLIGCSLLLIGLAPPTLFPLAVAGNFLAGIGIAMTNAPILSMLQAAIPAQMQGRVFGLLGSAALLPSPFTLAITGPTADQFGVSFWFAAAGCVTLVAVLLAARSRSFMRLEEGHPQQAAASV